jgi:hypothetical protein
MDKAWALDDRAKYFIALAIAVLALPAVLGSSPTIFNDGDVSWHLATGQWILDHRAIPRTDPFSFTWAGRPWVPIEWLAELSLATAYRLAGYAAVSALITAALLALHALVFFGASRAVRPLAALGIVVAMDLVLIPMMLARPHVLAWVLVASWTYLLIRAREKERAPPMAAALLLVVWANLHGSFVIGLVLAAFFGLEALVASADRGRALRQWCVFGFACLLAVFINANGIEGVVHPFRIANLEILPLVDEWKPSSPAVTPFFFVALTGVLVLLWLKRPKMHPVRWLLLAALLAMALLQVRHQAVLAIVSAVLLPQGFSRAVKPSEVRRVAAAATAAAAFALLVARLLVPITPAPGEANPWALIAAVPPELRSEPVLNGYVMGGPLILSGIRTYVDGRADMYGDELVADYKKITDGDAERLDAAVRRWNIRWAILPHRYKKLVALLDRSAGWQRLRQDSTGIIYVRR